MSSENKFTAGPWRLLMKKTATTLFARILAKDGGDTGRELIVIGMEDNHPIKEHIERRAADIELMSIAPEMYDMLERIMEESRTSKPAQFKRIVDLLNRINNK